MSEEERKEPEQPKLPELGPIVIDHNKKVAIVGTSHSWMLAPFDDESFEDRKSVV